MAVLRRDRCPALELERVVFGRAVFGRTTSPGLGVRDCRRVFAVGRRWLELLGLRAIVPRVEWFLRTACRLCLDDSIMRLRICWGG